MTRGGESLKTSVGTVLGGRYRVNGTLGTGGMAVVYKAEDAVLGRCVALKTLHRRYAEEVSFRSRFKQEARVMASLDHENVVKVYDISQEGDVPFIVAEYVGGRDVGEMLKSAPRGRLSEQDTKEIAAQLLEALAYAHLRGVVHRDVKPSNILFTEGGVVKVADFGIARLIEEEEAGEPGEIIGSARYMSPEQLKGEETTPRSDLYSVGILLYHCLTGRPPFSGSAKSVARQQIHREPTPPSELNKEISPHLEAVILKALAKDPQDRYPSAFTMLEDLRGRAADLPEVEESGEQRVRRRRHARRRRGGGRKALLASAALALLLLVGGGAAAAEFGYVSLKDPPIPGQAEEEALTPTAQPSSTEEAPTTAQPSSAGEALTLTAQPPTAAESPPPSAPNAPRKKPKQDAGNPPPPSQAVPTVSEDTAPEVSQNAATLAPVPSVNADFDYFAAQILQNSGFRPQVVYGYREGYAPKGVTWGTDPVVGTMMPVGSTVTVYATPKDQPQVEQPPLLNQPQIVG